MQNAFFSIMMLRVLLKSFSQVWLVDRGRQTVFSGCPLLDVFNPHFMFRSFNLTLKSLYLF